MPDPNATPTKLISLGNLTTYTTLANQTYEPQTVTLTYAQYQALTPAEKNNGKTYFVPDAPDPGSGDLGSMIFSLTGTLVAGQTSLTFTDDRLTANSMLDFFYPGVSDVTFDTFTQNSATSFTLTFEERSSDLLVKVLVYNL